jgi:hypothetical protein
MKAKKNEFQNIPENSQEENGKMKREEREKKTVLMSQYVKEVGKLEIKRMKRITKDTL